jgi:hypothetical protein
MHKTARIIQLVLIAIVAGVSCHEATGPKTITPPVTVTPPGVVAPQPGSGNAFVWVMVVEASGLCIPGATVSVTSGQRAGETVTMKTPCDAWSVDGGYFFERLNAGEEMTLQAWAPGYEAQEKRVIPASGPQTSFEFVLSQK